MPTIEFAFVASKLAIRTNPFYIRAWANSPRMTLAATDDVGNTATSFFDSVTLHTESAGGQFSLNGLTNWSSGDTFFYLSMGARNFYYRDTLGGTTFITASRDGLTAAGQAESIVPEVISTPQDRSFIGAYYYTWYIENDWSAGKTPGYLSYVRAFLDNPHTPYLGEYSSADQSVVDKHIEWASDYGIDVFITTWWGPGGQADINNKLLRDRLIATGKQIKMSIIYESTGRLGDSLAFSPSGITTFVNDFVSMANNYFSYPCYLKINDRPVVFLYVSSVFTGDVEGGITQMRNALKGMGYEPYLVSDDMMYTIDANTSRRLAWYDAMGSYGMWGNWWNQYPGVSGYFDTLSGYFQSASNVAAQQHIQLIPWMGPGYNDRGQRLGSNNAPCPRQFTATDSEGSSFDHLYPIGKLWADTQVKMIWITSWNEWWEDSILEPTTGSLLESTGPDFLTNGFMHQDYGFRYLEINRDQAVAVTGKVYGGAPGDTTSPWPWASIEVYNMGMTLMNTTVAVSDGRYRVSHLMLDTGVYYVQASRDGISNSVTVDISSDNTCTFADIFMSAPRKTRIYTPVRTLQVDTCTVSDTIGAELLQDSVRWNTFTGPCTATSSTLSGRFSLDRVNWTSVNYISLNLVNGETSFFFRDSVAGSPTIIIRTDTWPDTSQDVSVQQGPVSNTTSFFYTNIDAPPANGTYNCSIIITIKDSYGNPLAGKTCVITSSRYGLDTIVQPPATNAVGQCTGSVRSSTTGVCTITIRCDGNSITENLVTNPSFEEGSLDYPDEWTQDWWQGTGNYRSSIRRYSSGKYSLAGSTANYGASRSRPINVTVNSVYQLYGWIWNSQAGGTAAYYDLSGATGQPTLSSTNGFGAWQFLAGNFTNATGYSTVRVRAATNALPASSTSWFDAVYFRRVPTLNFIAATQVKIMSSAFTIYRNFASLPITAEAQDNNSWKDLGFNNTVTLLTNSATGKFSISDTTWVDTTNIYFVNGAGTFYFRDSAGGFPWISVQRAGLTSNQQQETILTVCDTVSFMTLGSLTCPLGGGANSITVTVNLRDISDSFVTNQLVSLTTQRGSPTTLVGPSQNLITDINGQATWTISSANAGVDTVTATAAGRQITNRFFENGDGYAAGSNGYPKWTINNGTYIMESGVYDLINTEANGGWTTFGGALISGSENWTNFTLNLRVRTVSRGTDWRQQWQ